MSDISLILYRDGKTFDISELVESIKWKGRKYEFLRESSYLPQEVISLPADYSIQKRCEISM